MPNTNGNMVYWSVPGAPTGIFGGHSLAPMIEAMKNERQKFIFARDSLLQKHGLMTAEMAIDLHRQFNESLTRMQDNQEPYRGGFPSRYRSRPSEGWPR